MRIESALCTVAAFMILLSPVPLLSQAHDEAPHAETRLWTQDDIETYYAEMKRFEPGTAWPERDKLAAEVAAKIRQIDDAVMGAPRVFRYSIFLPYVISSEANQRALPSSLDNPSVIMRRVAYNILKHWPEAAPAVNQVLWTNNPGTNHRVEGIDLLRRLWHHWRWERQRLFKYIEGMNYSGAVEAMYQQWEDQWGKDPDMLPDSVPDNYLPEEFDGKWYLSVLLESPNLRFYAAMEKTGSIFEVWDSSNTAVTSHFANRNPTQWAPYPVELSFSLLDSENQIHLSDDYLADFKEPRVKLEPRSYWGPDGPSPHIAYDFEYPILDTHTGKWLKAKAVLSSDPEDHYYTVIGKLEEFKSKGYDLGKDLRALFGEYDSPAN